MKYANSLAQLVNTKPRQAKTFQQYLDDNPEALPLLLEQMCLVMNNLDMNVTSNNIALEKVTEQLNEMRLSRKTHTLTKEDVCHYLMKNFYLLEKLVFDGKITLKTSGNELSEEDSEGLDILIGLELTLKTEPQFINSIIHRNVLLTGIKQAFQHNGYLSRIKEDKDKQTVKSLIIEFIAQSTTRPRKNIPLKYLVLNSGLNNETVLQYCDELGYEKTQVNKVAHVRKR
jgi:hypothetical protein